MGEIQFRLIFALDFIYQHYHHRLELWNLNFLQQPFLHRYADAEAALGTPLYNCFDYVGGTIAPSCKPVLIERVVYSHDTRVHSSKFQTADLSNGLIINLRCICRPLTTNETELETIAKRFVYLFNALFTVDFSIVSYN